MIKIEDFKKEYDRNMDTLYKYIDDPVMGKITQWFMQAKCNPLVWMDSHHYSGMYSLGGFISIMHIIHHALVDDGEMCFPIIDGKPYIKFIDRYTYVDKHGEPDHWLADIDAFMAMVDEQHIIQIKRYFADELVRGGNVDELILKYQDQYSDFNPLWVNTSEMNQLIKHKRKIYDILNRN